MMKKLTILLTAVLLCGCGSADKTESKSSVTETTTEAPAFPVSSYIDMSDMTLLDRMEIPVFDYTNNYQGEKIEELTKYYDTYTTPDGSTLEFDEDKRLRYYHNANADDTEPEERFSEEYMRTYCDNVLREVVTDYDKFEYHDSICYYGTTTYELSTVYETETHEYHASISLSKAGDIERISVNYTERPAEEQIDHEYFDALFEKQMDTMFENNDDYHHYTLEYTNYYLYGDYVYAEYTVITYDNPIVEGSDNPDDYPAYGHTLGFAKKLE